MRGKSGDAAQRKAAQGEDDEPFLGHWRPAAVAPVLSALLPARVCPNQLRRRAVALGLLREPPAGRPYELTAPSLSRLFLAGFRVPAHVERGDAGSLARHLRERRRVFALLHAQELDHRATSADPLRAYELLAYPAEPDGAAGIVLVQPGGAESDQFRLPLAIFLHNWETAGRLAIVAARSWSDLPSAGSRFFGGSRGKDGTFHWETADCDTTADGDVVR